MRTVDRGLYTRDVAGVFSFFSVNSIRRVTTEYRLNGKLLAVLNTAVFRMTNWQWTM
jgi:hypothetical protein